jgi:drug/metabolite transporter (DMT)-like permease
VYPQRQISTVMGAAAILIWSCTIAVSRSLAETVGALTAGACMFLIGGVLGCLYAGAIRRRFGAMLRLPRAYLLGCGAMFVAYMVCLYLAIGLATSRQQTLEVGILNYLWPGLTLVLAIPILRVRVRATFAVGVVLALCGAALAPLRPGEYSAAALAETLRLNPGPYALAVAAAVLWALYSTLSRRWAGAAEESAVPLFALATGIVLAALRPAFPEPADWTVRPVVEILFMAVFPTLIAYAFWDRAVRKGNHTLVAALSYSIPVLSTFITSLYLDVTVGWNLWLACGLIVVGAVLCERSVIEPARGGAGPEPSLRKAAGRRSSSRRPRRRPGSRR